MKIKLTAIALLLIATMGNIAPAEAQTPVLRETIPFPDGPDRQAYVVTIPIASLKKVRDHWNDYVGNDAYGWESQKKGIHRQQGIIEKTISARKFSVYNEIVMTESGVRLTIWLDQRGKPLVASKEGDKLDLAIKKYIQDFAIHEYKRAIQIKLKDEQKLKRDMKLELAALNRAQENPKHAISDLEFRSQTAVLNRKIESQNLKMQELLDMLNVIL